MTMLVEKARALAKLFPHLVGHFAGFPLVFRLWILAGDGRGSLRRGLCQRKFTGQDHKNNGKKCVQPLTVFPHTDTRPARYIRRCLSLDVQMPVPSCASCRPCLALILTARLPHDIQFFDAYRHPVLRMFIWCRRYTHQ